jgi:hypothetical protein
VGFLGRKGLFGFYPHAGALHIEYWFSCPISKLTLRVAVLPASRIVGVSTFTEGETCVSLHARA